MANVKVALVGGAHIHTPNFINKLNSRRGVTVRAVWDPDPERAQRRAEALNAPLVNDPRTIWKDPEVNAVVICSETDLHERLVLAAARAGKHMFVEKPLGMTGADARRMARAVTRADVIFQTGYFMRSNPVSQFLRRQVAAGAFGTITRVRGSNCHSGSLGGWFDTEWRWMTDPARAGCGAFGDLGTHSLDVLMWLFGDLDAVTARIEPGTARYAGCDEFGEALLTFRSGVVGTLAAGWIDVANPMSMEICGTEGHAMVKDGSLFFHSKHVKGADGKEPWTKLPKSLPHAFDLFLDAVSGKKNVPLVSVDEAAARSRAMEAIYRAAVEQTWVKVR